MELKKIIEKFKIKTPILIKNSWIPEIGPDHFTFTIRPFIFYKEIVEIPTYQLFLTHAKIHYAQQKELGLLKFFYLYIKYHYKYGYKYNPFERECFYNQKFPTYLEVREKDAWKLFKISLK